jgi:acetyl-CoA C-acetyltransferase
VAIAGGVESMTRVPMGSSSVPGLGDARNARFASHWEITTQFDGADRLAAIWGFGRDDLDEYALRSQARAARAIAEGRFGSQIVALEAPVVDEAARLSAPRRSASTKDNRGGQQGPGSADLRTGRLRRDRGPIHGDSAASGGN